MKFSGKIEDGTSNEPLNFGSKLLPCRMFALTECILRAKIYALRVLLVIIIIIIFVRKLCFHRHWFVCLSVRLSVSKITQKVMDGFRWNSQEMSEMQ